MTFDSMLCHSAEVFTQTRVLEEGRPEMVWTSRGGVKCRFAIPSPSRVNISGGYSVADEHHVAATLYVNSDAFSLTAELPVRFVTADEGWEGKYELRVTPRAYYDKERLHHLELDVVRCEE